MVLNVDGSPQGNPGPVGFGGLLRTSEGEWRGHFFGSIGVSDNTRAELATLFFGLKFTWDSGERHLICYSDSLLAIELVKKVVASTHRDATLIWGIQDLMVCDWELELAHTLRKGNGSADRFLKIGAS